MINTKRELDFFLMADMMMNRGESHYTIRQKVFELFFPDYIMRYLIAMRKYSYYKGQRMGVGNTIMSIFYGHRFRKLGVKLGFSIGPDCFDYGLVIPHYGTIVVGPSNKIGKYSVLHTSVCITDTTQIIGEGLYCSTGCKLTFNGGLGNNVTVGANAVVTKEVDLDNVLLTSIPAIVKSTRSAWYIDDIVYSQRVSKVEQMKNK